VISIESYRSVFDLERRIYRVDKLRLNPSGVPVRGVVYFAALLLVALLARVMPLLGEVVQVLPWWLRDVALPGAGATLLGAVRIEGRPFHLAAWALARFACGPSRLLANRAAPRSLYIWRPRKLLVLADGSEARLRKLRFIGPGTVTVRVAHERVEWHPSALERLRGRERVTVRELSGRRARRHGEVIGLRRGTRLAVTGDRPTR
jgi:hypothetical protein